MPEDHPLTTLLGAYRNGDESVLPQLFERVYAMLYGIAQRQRRQWQGDHTLGTTALVHEAYLKLVEQNAATYRDRAHFLAIASQAMRHILIDYARRRKAARRGGHLKRVDIDEVFNLSEQRIDELLDLHDALEKLAQLQPRQARVVECHIFGGMQINETAEALGLSKTTVKRDWAAAKAFLFQKMNAHS